MESGQHSTLAEHDSLLYGSVYWSPDERYLALSDSFGTYPHADLKVINLQGESVLDSRLINIFHYISPRWLDDHRLLAQTDEEESEGNTTSGYQDSTFDLTLFDFETGEQYLLAENISRARLSADKRYVASVSGSAIHLTDVSEETPVSMDDIIADADVVDLFWRSDSVGLAALLRGNTLQGYDLNMREWHLIAEIPDTWEYIDDNGLGQHISWGDCND